MPSMNLKFHSLLLFVSLSLNMFQFYNVKINFQFQSQNQIETMQRKKTSLAQNLSNEKGFHPIFVYSNQTRAASEIPLRSKVKKFNLYGKQPYSQSRQDLIIFALAKENWDLVKVDQMKSEKKFFFIDLAANHALRLSNTLYLEQNDWDGICIEGNPAYWFELGKYRKCIVVGAFVGGNSNNDGQQVEIVLNGIYGGIVGNDFDNKEQDNNSKVVVKRDLVSITTILDGFNCPKVIDYISLDVEGAESLIMQDFPWEKYKFLFMTIERPKNDLVKLLNSHGYTEATKITKWGETLWIHNKFVKLSEQKIQEIIMSI